MAFDTRTDIINKISRTMSIMMCDMKLQQSMNIFSMNIHAEDFFRDIFNFLDPIHTYSNANSAGSNEAYIDLVDHSSKRVMQITTTTDKDKIDNSLQILKQQNYLQYEFEIYYLLDKPEGLRPTSIKQYQDNYGIEDIRDHLKDFRDILDRIKSLDQTRLEAIYRLHFQNMSERYTDEISLQIVFEALIQDKKYNKENYHEDFNNKDLDDKIDLNDLNRKVGFHLHEGNQAAMTIHELENKDILTSLRELIVDDFYAKLLKSALQKSGVKAKDLAHKPVIELHALAKNTQICFNQLLGELCRKIEDMTFNANYKETSMAWVIISYFFEECDIGMKV